jgi:hypothetical protein
MNTLLLGVSAPNMRHAQSKSPPASASRERVVDWLVGRTLEELNGRRRVPLPLALFPVPVEQVVLLPEPPPKSLARPTLATAKTKAKRKPN